MSREQETKDDDRRRTNEMRADAFRYASDPEKDKAFSRVVATSLLDVYLTVPNGHDYPAKD